MISKKLRVLSAVVVTSFLFQDLSFAALELKPTEIPLFQSPLVSFELPKSIATIGDTYKGRNPETIILVQDAHTNDSAQINTSKALNFILQKEEIPYIYLEAASGNSSLAIVRDKAPLEKRKQVAMKYLRKGTLDGVEYLDMTSDHNFIPWGVEDKKLYLESLHAYEKVAKNREKFQVYLNEVARAIETLKPQIYGPSLQEFDQKRGQFLKGKIALTEYIDVLMKQMEFRNIAKTHYPHLLALSQLKDKERSIDFDKANDEQMDAIGTLSEEDQQILDEAAMGGKDAPFKLSVQDHKTQKAFYALLEEKLEAGSSKLEANYPELQKYFAYLKDADKVDAKAVLEEQRFLEEEIYDSLTKTSDERDMHRADTGLRFLQKLFELTVTPDEFRTYKKDKEAFDIKTLTGFLNRKIMDLGDHYDRVTFLKDDYDEYVKSAEAFYRLTYERDLAFLDKMFDKMKKEGQKTSVLVTGGYHTPNLTGLLQDKNASYIVVTPQVLNETNKKRYESLLMGQDEKDILAADEASVSADKMDYFQSTITQMPALQELGITRQALVAFRTQMSGYVSRATERVSSAYATLKGSARNSSFINRVRSNTSAIAQNVRAKAFDIGGQTLDITLFREDVARTPGYARTSNRITPSNLFGATSGARMAEGDRTLLQASVSGARFADRARERQPLTQRLSRESQVAYAERVYQKGLITAEQAYKLKVQALYGDMADYSLAAQIDNEIAALRNSSEDLDPTAQEKLVRDITRWTLDSQDINLQKLTAGGFVSVRAAVQSPRVQTAIDFALAQLPYGGVAMGSRLAQLSPAQKDSLDKAATLFNLSPAGKGYLAEMFRQYHYPNSAPKQIVVDRNSADDKGNFQLASALTEDEVLNIMKVYEYLTLDAEPANIEAAKNVVVTVNSMDGGIGENMGRLEELIARAQKAGLPTDNIRMGAKGTDLGDDLTINGQTYFVSIAERKLNQLIILAKENKFSGMKFQPLVNWQSKASYDALLESVYLFDKADPMAPQRTYREVFSEVGIEILPMLEQEDLPSIDKSTGLISSNPEASRQPGGHGQWGFYFFHDIFTRDIPVDGQTHIRIFLNGDNNNSRANATIAGAMARNRWPLVKLVTPATLIDKKGGKDGVRVITIEGTDVLVRVPDQMELADAKAVGQTDLFQDAGQVGGIGRVGKQPFNTNMIYFNETELQPILRELGEIIGAEELEKVFSPTLIRKDAKKAKDGNEYIPVDAAIGVAVHNLNTYFMASQDPRVRAILEKRGLDRLLYFVNIPRILGFTPNKNNFDLRLQQAGGFYNFNIETMAYEEKNPGTPLPEVEFVSVDANGKDDKYWNEQKRYTDAFAGADFSKLGSLSVYGKVTATNTDFVGNVVIRNESSAVVDLNSLLSRHPELLRDSRLLLQNIEIRIDKDGVLTTGARLADVRSILTQARDNRSLVSVAYSNFDRNSPAWPLISSSTVAGRVQTLTDREVLLMPVDSLTGDSSKPIQIPIIHIASVNLVEDPSNAGASMAVGARLAAEGVWQKTVMLGDQFPYLIRINADNTLDILDKGSEKVLYSASKSFGIGRDEKNDFVTPPVVNSVSRFHAQFSYSEGQQIWTLTDLGSTNGTFVDGVRIDPNDKPLRLVTGARLADAQVTGTPVTTSPVDKVTRSQLMSGTRGFRGSVVPLVEVSNTPIVDGVEDRDLLDKFIQKVGDTEGAAFALKLNTLRLFTIALASATLSLISVGDAEAYSVPVASATNEAGFTHARISTGIAETGINPISVPDAVIEVKTAMMKAEAIDAPPVSVPTLITWKLSDIVNFATKDGLVDEAIFKAQINMIAAAMAAARGRNPLVQSQIATEGVAPSLAEMAKSQVLNKGMLVDVEDFQGIVVQIVRSGTPGITRLSNGFVQPVNFGEFADSVLDVNGLAIYLAKLVGSVQRAFKTTDNKFDVSDVKPGDFDLSLISYIQSRSSDPAAKLTGLDVKEGIFGLIDSALAKIAFRLPLIEKLGARLTQVARMIATLGSAA